MRSERVPDGDYSGMSISKRLSISGLTGEFDAAARNKDRLRMISILKRVSLSEIEATRSTDTILADPGRYGY